MANINLAGKIIESYLSKFNDTEFIIFRILVDDIDENDPFAIGRVVRVEIIPNDMNMPQLVEAFKKVADFRDEKGRYKNGFVGKFVHFVIGEQENVNNGTYHYTNYYPNNNEKPIMNDVPEWEFSCQNVPERKKKNNKKGTIAMHC